MKTVLATLVLLLFTAAVRAEQHGAVVAGKPVVVHTRLAPVVAHRMFPPYLGAHQWSRKVEGQKPRATAPRR